MQPTTATLERTFQDSLTAAMVRTEEMQPVDRWSTLERFEFAIQFTGEQTNATIEKCFLIPRPTDDDIRPASLVLSTAPLPPLELSKTALSQLMLRVEYPRRLLDMLPPKLSQLSVNYLMMNNLGDKQTFIRTIHGNQARAVLGGRYVPLDDAELLEIALPYIGADARVVWESFAETGTHISAVWQDSETPDGLLKGIHIINSEVGLRAVSIIGILYRSTCSNILPSLGYGGDSEGDGLFVRRRGRKADISKNTSGWRFTHTGDRGQLEGFIRDAVNDVARSNESMLQRYRDGLNVELDAISSIEDIVKSADLTKQQHRQVLDSYSQERNPTLTGVVNAFTRAAQTQDDPDERWYMQQVGTDILFSKL